MSSLIWVINTSFLITYTPSGCIYFQLLIDLYHQIRVAKTRCKDRTDGAPKERLGRHKTQGKWMCRGAKMNHVAVRSSYELGFRLIERFLSTLTGVGDRERNVNYKTMDHGKLRSCIQNCKTPPKQQ